MGSCRLMSAGNLREIIERVVSCGRCPAACARGIAHTRLHQAGLVAEGEWLVPVAKVPWLNANGIREDLRSRGMNPAGLEVVACSESTNARMIKRAERQSIAGEVMLAESQVSGRGRRGREWFSPLGLSLSISMGMSVSLSADRFGLASLAVGVAIAETLESMGVDCARVNWPNDVEVDGAKMAGVLVELVHPEDAPELVVGFGINTGGAALLRRWLARPVTDVSEHLSGDVRHELAVGAIVSVNRLISELEGGGLDSVIARWRRRDALEGKSVEVRTSSETIQGIAAGIDACGALLLHRQGRLERLVGGEVSVRSIG
ncbi:MAG: biotin--[acetyl-CoA-carboxylase] ligase [Pseudomonadales bacterium]|nr:biotin--[acetyl-CoA-carboxylase] ligase [Pseudomonadales bacterium]